jgi:hypothetical protein
VWPPIVERQVGSARWTRLPNEIKCGLYGGKQRKTKSGTVSWLSLKTKVESGRRGGQVMSGIGVEAAPRPRGLRRSTTKLLGFLGCATKPRPEARRTETGSGRVERLRSGGHASGSQGLRRGEARCGRRASVRWCYDENSQSAHWGRVS